MRHTAIIASVVALTSLLIGTVAARVTDSPAPAPGEIVRFCMNHAPDGPCVTRFPAGTDVVYAVLKYADMQGEKIRVIVYDSIGNTLFDQTISLTGSGTRSFEIRYYGGPPGAEPVAFPTGMYLTNLYIGEFLSESLFWKVNYMVFLPLILRNY